MTVAEQQFTRINIGSRFTRLPGFANLDIRPGTDVDLVRDAGDLKCFANGSLDEIRASNVFEHIPITRRLEVLKEWARALRPGGILWLSVPDFNFCVDIYLKSGRVMDPWLEYHLYGEQGHDYQYHYACYNFAQLRGLLHDAGFSEAERILDLPGELNDASHLRDTRFGMRIALNIKAIR